jgi:hypothetical protein
VVRAVDWVDCAGRVYFVARYPDWRTVVSLPAEDVAFIDEV